MGAAHMGQGWQHPENGSYGMVFSFTTILHIKKAGQTKTINIQEIGHVGKYVVGRYDLEIPIYPLMEVKDVEIHQSNTTTVEIPTPGLITFLSKKPGAGSLYRLNEYADQIWVLNLLENRKTQGFYLQPGSYRVIFRREDLKPQVSPFDPGDMFSNSIYLPN